MGVADLIPGVSGGTIAFITGIYEGLLEAVASINKDVFKSLLTFKFKEVASKVHLRFIIPLGMGMVLAILSLARVMHYLIKEQPVPTWALFFGLIAASVIVIWKQLEDHFHVTNLLMIAFGALFAYFIVGLIPVNTPDDWWFIYLCGVIGITAMILPGISGSFLLLILGKYEYITGAVKNPLIPDNMVILFVFLCGTGSGLLGFSKILNWLMKHYHSLTMAWLTGILIGSMRKVWPWKEVLETKIIRGKVKILREANVMPPEINNEVWLAVGLIIVGFVAVLWMDHHSSQRKTTQLA
ncbi:MAG: DUF368 domain-containing protein [Bacteriovoracaceae bacterium]|nr:DUF368 domain-containing protein [Bacteriovoracaceae bacterium]